MNLQYRGNIGFLPSIVKRILNTGPSVGGLNNTLGL